MLSRVKEWYRARYAPVLPPQVAAPDPLAEWARVMEMAANAWPIELERKLTAVEVKAVAGYEGNRWDALREAMRDGGELWHFRSVREAWTARCGRAGISLIRDGSPVCSVVTLVS